jgi:RNA methyltransferase, TrmH family
MISKAQISHIKSLKLKKYRDQHKQFIAEGTKIIDELLHSSFIISTIFAIKDWIYNVNSIPQNCTVIEVSDSELLRISSLKTPNKVLAIVNIFHSASDSVFASLRLCVKNELILMLDNINDPGNLGTIIRIADWFGISNIICSNNSVDVYNPKVIQATMGSIARVNVHYDDLKTVLSALSKSGQIKIYGALLEGESIYNKPLTDKGIIIIGNESNGISDELLPFINEKINIPYYPINLTNKRAESLNASVATGIICSEFRRQNSL